MPKLNMTDVKLSNGDSFTIVHNIPMKGNIDSFQAALDNWLNRTDDFSPESFCEYINGKTRNGKSTYIAVTKEQYDKY